MILCLSCGKQLKDEREAIEHNEYFIREEERSFAQGDPSKIVRRHVVQIGMNAGPVNGQVGRRA